METNLFTDFLEKITALEVDGTEDMIELEQTSHEQLSHESVALSATRPY
jgi:hypothetical protein